MSTVIKLEQIKGNTRNISEIEHIKGKKRT